MLLITLLSVLASTVIAAPGLQIGHDAGIAANNPAVNAPIVNCSFMTVYRTVSEAILSYSPLEQMVICSHASTQGLVDRALRSHSSSINASTCRMGSMMIFQASRLLLLALFASCSSKSSFLRSMDASDPQFNIPQGLEL